MAKCKNCHTEIPDGMEYCSNCEENNRMKADESYLDNLLNSVISDTPPSRTVSRTADNTNTSDTDYIEKKTQTIEKKADNETTDIESIKQEVPDKESYKSELPNIESIKSEVPDIESFKPESSEDSSEYNIFNTNDDFLEDVFNDSSEFDFMGTEDESLTFHKNEADNYSEDVSTPLAQMSESELDKALDFQENYINESPPDIPDSLVNEPPSDIPKELMSESPPDVPEELISESPPDIPADNLADLDILNMDYFDSLADGDTANDNSNNVSSDETEFFSQEDQYKTEDDLALAEILENYQESIDVDKVVESIETGDFDKELMELIPEEEKEKLKKKKKKKKNIFVRLFGNVREDLSPEELKERQEEEQAKQEQLKQQEEEKKRLKSLSKEERKKQKESDAAEKKAKADKLKSEKAAADKIKKEQAAEEARKKKEEKLAVLQIEQNHGRINRLGTAILLVFFTLLTIFIVYGTDFYSYKVSINSAATNFERQRYNEAYKDVYGLDIKDEDIVLYDKIMTVMYVNKQLNSYNNYYAVNMQAQALDSLIKGLSRYEKYYDLAIKLGIVQDMNIVRDRILNELEKVFHLSEEKAMALIDINEQADYTMQIYALLNN